MKSCKTCGTEVPDNATKCPTCGGPVGDPVIPANGQANGNGNGGKKKNPLLKIIVAVVIVVIAIGAIGSCSNCSSKSTEPWPTGELAQMIPSMDRKCEHVFETKDSLSITVSDRISKSDYDNYVKQCKEWGYTLEAESDSDEYEAFNAEGYKLEVRFWNISGDQIDIHLYAPKATGELVWPTTGLATKLPNPNKAQGKIAVDSSSEFTAYIGSMNQAEFKAYVEQCIAKGFNTDYSKSDKSFSAKNKQGDSLQLIFEGFDTVYIGLHAAKEESASSSSSSSTSSTSSSSSSSTSPSADFKKAMDDYEKFMDDYIAFMKKYSNSSNAAGMASDYAKWMSDYADMVEEIDAIDEDSLSTADYKYYTEVTARVAKKLTDAGV